MTRTQFEQRTNGWNQAIAEGRMIRVDDGATFTIMKSADDARSVVEQLRALGRDAAIVDPSLARLF